MQEKDRVKVEPRSVEPRWLCAHGSADSNVTMTHETKCPRKTPLSSSAPTWDELFGGGRTSPYFKEKTPLEMCYKIV